MKRWWSGYYLWVRPLSHCTVEFQYSTLIDFKSSVLANYLDWLGTGFRASYSNSRRIFFLKSFQDLKILKIFQNLWERSCFRSLVSLGWTFLHLKKILFINALKSLSNLLFNLTFLTFFCLNFYIIIPLFLAIRGNQYSWKVQNPFFP